MVNKNKLAPLRFAKVALALALIISIYDDPTSPTALSAIVAYLLVDMIKTTWRMF